MEESTIKLIKEDNNESVTVVAFDDPLGVLELNYGAASPTKGAAGNKQKYRKVWENDETFKGWLTGVEKNPYVAFCEACKCKINAHKKDLKDHASSRKHQRNLTSFQTDTLSLPITSKKADFYYDYDPEYHADPINSKIKVDPGRNKRTEIPRPQGTIIKQYVDRCSRWCCQGPELPPVIEDIHTSFGRYVSDELRIMKNDYDRQMCKMKINTVFFEACTGKYDIIDNVNAKTSEKQYCLPQLTHEMEIDDELTSFGRYIGNELKSLKNLHARQVIKHKINEILFEGTAFTETHVIDSAEMDQLPIHIEVGADTKNHRINYT